MKTEFRDRERPGEIDLKISVYEVGTEQIVQAYAEHCASFTDPKPHANVDLAGWKLVSTPGETDFNFTRNAHRELRFQDVAELQNFLTSTVLPDLQSRRIVVEKTDVKAYAHERRNSGDPEWLAFYAKRPKWP